MISPRDLSPQFGFANPSNRGLFDLGAIVGTPGAVVALQKANAQARDLLLRHISGDWGEIHPGDVGENEAALEQGLRIFSVYILPQTGEKVWIITEWDRSVTTILTPGEY